MWTVGVNTIDPLWIFFPYLLAPNEKIPTSPLALLHLQNAKMVMIEFRYISQQEMIFFFKLNYIGQ